MQNLSGLNVLVVEDEYLIARELSQALAEAGVRVIGPCGSVRHALDCLAGTPDLDAAILDVNLLSEKVYPVAEGLAERGIPFVFITGYDADEIPEQLRGVKRIEKPAAPDDIICALSAARSTLAK